MRKFLVRFFQVVCFLQLFGFGQVNAHPEMGNSYSSLITYSHETQHGYFDVEHKGPAAKINLFPSPFNEVASLSSENIDEKDYEPVSPKKDLVSKDHFTSGLYANLPSYLSDNDQNSLAFCKQLSFFPANKRYVIFRVFRI